MSTILSFLHNYFRDLNLSSLKHFSKFYVEKLHNINNFFILVFLFFNKQFNYFLNKIQNLLNYSTFLYDFFCQLIVKNINEIIIRVEQANE
jgi:hypothetical protein